MKYIYIYGRDQLQDKIRHTESRTEEMLSSISRSEVGCVLCVDWQQCVSACVNGDE